MAHRFSRTLMIGGLLAALALAPSARAADGRITFNGMIVETTCAVSVGDMASLATDAGSGAIATSRGSCGQAPAGVHAGSRYELAVTTLVVDRQADQLLSYFGGYVRASGATAHLVTQTYE
ncbi:hypothetical protein [Frateuria sp. STR12]|uniref:hypothetical protein n=1 Tax=Frateuria hangzhouensis TaxID=2995589 RepID=UPI002260A099|nr:hypothetical protein [Frateuria sp. STR12]MCX7512606.1 hypothetical protein [Frateuria sp. STR12]